MTNPESYHAERRVGDDDIFDNRLIFGDNLLALKQEYAGKVKCCFIDPPYNTGSDFTHYDDGLEHSIWLSLMRDRLEIIRRLLAEDGSLWITIDDNEAHYLKVVGDEIFGRDCYVSILVWEKADSSRNSARQFSTDHDDILVFSKMPDWQPYRLARTEEANAIYKNPDNDPKGPWLPGDPYANKPYSKGLYDVVGPTGLTFSPPPGRFWRVSEMRSPSRCRHALAMHAAHAKQPRCPLHDRSDQQYCHQWLSGTDGPPDGWARQNQSHHRQEQRGQVQPA